MTALKCGDEILLIDSRGCHTLHVVREQDYRSASYFVLGGQIWTGFPFTLTSEVDVAGRPVYRSTRPAIGSRSSRFHPHFVPMGWSAPRFLRLVLPARPAKEAS